jgi:hypothetical protein
VILDIYFRQVRKIIMAISNNISTGKPGIKKTQFGFARINLIAFLVISLVVALVIFQIGREVAPMVTPNTSVPTEIIVPQNPALPQFTTAPGVSAPPVTTQPVVKAKTAAPVAKTAAPKPVTKGS